MLLQPPIGTLDHTQLPYRVLHQQAQRREARHAVHDAEGAQLALVADRKMAFRLARQNDMAPVSVH